MVQVLPSETVNLEVPTISFTIFPWETVNLWDVLGPDVFDMEGSAAILAYATVINQQTGDASYLFASPSVVGASVAKAFKPLAGRPEVPRVETRIVGYVRQ